MTLDSYRHDHHPADVQLRDVEINYGPETAIRDAHLHVTSGQVLALVGPSGCGKSTLLSSINRMTDLVAKCTVNGTILVGGQSVRDIPLRTLRRRVGMVFQKPNPFPLSIAENIEFPLKEHGVHSRKERRRRSQQALEEIGLWEEVKDRLNHSALRLSGGQQQRLCLARALALEPEVLLLDEPCSALDPMSSEVVEKCLKRLRDTYTIIIVTHNLAQARRIADSTVVFWTQHGVGRVIESGDTEQIFTQPAHPITKAYCHGEAG